MSRPEIAEAYGRLNLDSFGINGIDSMHQTLDNLLANSDEKLIKNTIQETYDLLDKAQQESITGSAKQVMICCNGE